MRRALLVAAAAALGAAEPASSAPGAAEPQWILASPDARAQAGERFEVLVLSLSGEAPPEELPAKLRAGPEEFAIALKGEAVVQEGRRRYVGVLPAEATGPVELELAGRASSVLVLLAAAPKPVPVAPGTPAPAPVPVAAAAEPPISENDPMYFVVGARQGYSARFQLSFKYRLFDPYSGFGQQQPWLSGFYFGYTQNSLWDLSAQSKPFRDTSYRPSLFWRWQRTDDRTWIDGLRLGVEHESNGGGTDRSRSINILFARPEWHWTRPDGSRFEFTPKIYGYLDKDENPDINHYRGNVDWRLRFDTGENWIATAVARVPNTGKGSFLLDASRRIRDLRFGPVGGYLHFQFFTGYGEDILDYNLRRKTQFRIGFAIVP